MKKIEFNVTVLVLTLCAMPSFAWAFEISAGSRSCVISSDSGVKYLEDGIAGEISRKAFQACPGQAVRQVSEIKFDAKRVDDGNCEAFDEVVTGSGDFECIPSSR